MTSGRRFRDFSAQPANACAKISAPPSRTLPRHPRPRRPSRSSLGITSRATFARTSRTRFPFTRRRRLLTTDSATYSSGTTSTRTPRFSMAFLGGRPDGGDLQVRQALLREPQLPKAFPHGFNTIHAGEDQPVVGREIFGAVSSGRKERGLRISMKGISRTSAPSLRSSVESEPAWWRARPTRTRMPARLADLLSPLRDLSRLRSPGQFALGLMSRSPRRGQRAVRTMAGSIPVTRFVAIR